MNRRKTGGIVPVVHLDPVPIRDDLDPDLRERVAEPRVLDGIRGELVEAQPQVGESPLVERHRDARDEDGRGEIVENGREVREDEPVLDLLVARLEADGAGRGERFGGRRSGFFFPDQSDRREGCRPLELADQL